jgi:hypothetical protein
LVPHSYRIVWSNHSSGRSRSVSVTMKWTLPRLSQSVQLHSQLVIFSLEHRNFAFTLPQWQLTVYSPIEDVMVDLRWGRWRWWMWVCTTSPIRYGYLNAIVLSCRKMSRRSYEPQIIRFGSMSMVFAGDRVDDGWCSVLFLCVLCVLLYFYFCTVFLFCALLVVFE